MVWVPQPYYLDWKESEELEVLVFWMPDWKEGDVSQIPQPS